MANDKRIPSQPNLPDPTGFNPYTDPFPEDQGIPGVLEWKLDVIITKLHDINQSLVWGIGCIMPVLIVLVAFLGVVPNLFNWFWAFGFAVFAYVLYLVLNFLARRFFSHRS